MVLMNEGDLAGIPVIHACPIDGEGVPLPTIFVFHGYTSSKELNSYYGYMLAKAGFRVILPEAEMHGARFDGNHNRRLGSFWDILKKNIDELPLIRDAAGKLGLIDEGRIGVAGISMGGFAVYGALVRYEWIRSAASFMGSPYFTQLMPALYPPFDPNTGISRIGNQSYIDTIREYDPSLYINKLASRPLLVWHGEQDEIVPFDESLRLQKELASLSTANVTFLNDASAGHKVSMSGAEAGVKFFVHHL